jgi:glycosyltransferase involved in cell wall biosynthesis
MANSEAMKRNLIAEGIPATEMIRNFVPDRLPRPPLSSPPTVAFAGQLSLEKGVEVLFSAFAKIADKIPDARLIIAGTGTKQNILKKQIADSGLSNRVSMPGYLTYHEMERQFDSAWVQAVPTRCIEAFGNVAAEAMIRGTAVIASDSGGLPEIVRHGKTGLIVPPGDEDALAQGLLHLLQNRESAEQMGMAGREFALKHLNQNDYIDKIIRLYQKLCSL